MYEVKHDQNSRVGKQEFSGHVSVLIESVEHLCVRSGSPNSATPRMSNILIIMWSEFLDYSYCNVQHILLLCAVYNYYNNNFNAVSNMTSDLENIHTHTCTV